MAPSSGCARCCRFDRDVMRRFAAMEAALHKVGDGAPTGSAVSFKPRGLAWGGRAASSFALEWVRAREDCRLEIQQICRGSTGLPGLSAIWPKRERSMRGECVRKLACYCDARGTPLCRRVGFQAATLGSHRWRTVPGISTVMGCFLRETELLMERLPL